VYGISAKGLSEQTGGSVIESRRMINGWYERFPIAAEFIKKCRQAPLKGQIITTCFGRKKRVGLVTYENIHFLQNEAANFPHQSIASDITLHAGMRTEKQLRSIGVRIVNLVHDSIIMEVPKTKDNSIRLRAAQLVSEELERVPVDWGLTAIPFLADAEIGQRWGSLDKYDFQEAA